VACSSSTGARAVLLGSVFVVAACGLAYELIAGALSSYLLGDAVTQFSFVIGTFLSAMGAGAWIARFIHTRLVERFVQVEIAIGLLGGSASVLLFALNAFAQPVFPVCFYALCAVLGALVGIEIPLLVRIVKEGGGFIEALSDVLALDYLGALGGSLVFPLLVLPWLGLSRASVVFGLLNLAIAGAGISLVEHGRRRITVQLGLAFAVLVTLLVVSPRLVGFFEDVLYEDHVVFAKSSRYQRIVLTRWRTDVRLYLDGHLQFSSIDEARYHESLVVPAMEAAGKPRSVLILGGGDGLAAREVLKYPSVERIVLVDLDPEMTELARTRQELVALNLGALSSPKLTVVSEDAMRFVEMSEDFFDVVIIDLPDPNSEGLAKLYSTAFYALVARRLSAHGVLVTQATSPFYAREAFWCIAETLRATLPADGPTPGFVPVPYHQNVPSFGEWGFVLAARRPLDPSGLAPAMPARFLTPAVMQAMFAFGQDMQAPEVRVNRLDDPVVFRYHREGWRRFNQ